jgi:hypothetical protein
MGPPGQNGFEDLHPAFVGYTPTSFTGNLGGRTGANGVCNSAYPGSHFCIDWELDQAVPPPPASTAWIDPGNPQTSSRYFRAGYSTSDSTTCAGWTSASASATPDGINLSRGLVYTSLGAISQSFVGANDGGCENARPVACCIGGTSIRFRGLTAAKTAKLGGRTGANATCDAAFSGSHFCTDWEVDQASVHGPIPSRGAWIDPGNSQPSSRLYRAGYSVNDSETCAGWTTDSPSAEPDGLNLATALILTPLGGVGQSYVGANDGGCEIARPLACCDGSPPQ